MVRTDVWISDVHSRGSEAAPQNMASGSQADERGRVVDVERIAQAFSNPAYLQPTHSTAGAAAGFDPHLSLEAARLQVPRVASARQVDSARILSLLQARIESRCVGELRINALLVNLALDRQFGQPPDPPDDEP